MKNKFVAMAIIIIISITVAYLTVHVKRTKGPRLGAKGASKVTAKEILQHLDKYMDETLTLVNPNRPLADTRMTVFRSGKNWAIFIELVGTGKEIDAEIEIFAFGNCIEQQGLIETRTLFTVPEDAPLVNQEGIWIGDRAKFSVIIKGKRFDFTPTKEDYLEAGIVFPDDRTGPDSLRPIDLIRFLCHHLNHPFFVSEDYLRYLLDKLSVKKAEWYSLGQEMSLFYQTKEWEHPDLPAEKPSQMKYFRVLARAIEKGDVSELTRLDPSTFNTDWRKVQAELDEFMELQKHIVGVVRDWKEVELYFLPEYFKKLKKQKRKR